MKFLIKVAMGGGFGGIRDSDGEIYECKDLDDAYKLAYQLEREEYQSYEGSRGVRDEADIMEDEGCDEDTAWQIYNEEIDSWIESTVEEVKEEPMK